MFQIFTTSMRKIRKYTIFKNSAAGANLVCGTFDTAEDRATQNYFFVHGFTQ